MDFLTLKFLNRDPDHPKPDPDRQQQQQLRVSLLRRLSSHTPPLFRPQTPSSSSSLTPRPSRLQKPGPPSSPLSFSSATTTSIKTSASTASTSRPQQQQQQQQQQQPPPPPSPHFILLPNEDPLPPSFAALEGHLNHHASQLQQLAERVERINEWIDLDTIVLARLVRDEEKRVDEVLAAERAAFKVSSACADIHQHGGGVQFAI
ncbi:MAG: hypothetical protein LQ346_007622, partial [Caloplaca aetnensis]